MPVVMSIPHRVEVEAGEAVLRHVAPWASAIKFTVTGSEATHAALAIAMKATGRRRYARLVGSYHGWHLIWQDDAPNVTWFQVGDAALDYADLAAVFVEPPRWQSFGADWLRELRAQTAAHGTLLVFDEMIYGGRWALGGATELYGVVPDIATLGKAIGNGWPVACVVGHDAVAQHGQVVSGTYSGFPPSLQSVCDTVREYVENDVIGSLWARGRQLQQGLDAVVAQYPDLHAHREGMPVHQRIRFEDPTLGKRFSAEMASRGVLWHPDVVNVMYAHTADQIDQVIAAADASVQCL